MFPIVDGATTRQRDAITNQLIVRHCIPAHRIWPSSPRAAPRAKDGSWLSACSPQQLVEAAYDNPRNPQSGAIDALNRIAA
ncbi:hypothetical protein VDQ74_04525 [Xanthomonas campestris pv. campestris]|nr:hypothetical protein [Xanthomonas campestris pv. campestris]